VRNSLLRCVKPLIAAGGTDRELDNDTDHDCIFGRGGLAVRLRSGDHGLSWFDGIGEYGL